MQWQDESGFCWWQGRWIQRVEHAEAILLDVRSNEYDSCIFDRRLHDVESCCWSAGGCSDRRCSWVPPVRDRFENRIRVPSFHGRVRSRMERRVGQVLCGRTALRSADGHGRLSTGRRRVPPPTDPCRGRSSPLDDRGNVGADRWTQHGGGTDAWTVHRSAEPPAGDGRADRSAGRRCSRRARCGRGCRRRARAGLSTPRAR